TPTDYFGSIVKENLTNHAANAVATATALNTLDLAELVASVEFSYAIQTNSPGLAFAAAALADSSLAAAYAHRAASTQSAADWSTAEHYAWMAYGDALNDYWSSGNPYANSVSDLEFTGLRLATAVGTPETV